MATERPTQTGSQTGSTFPEANAFPETGKTQIQEFGTIRMFPLGLSSEARMYSCRRLNQILADTQILYNLYKKAHWLMRGPTFYQLHLLLDKHADEQLKLVDLVAERVQTLGGVAVGDPRHVAELTVIPRPPDGVEEVPAMLTRLVEAHEAILVAARDAARHAADLGDSGTDDLLVSDVIRTGELQAWFLIEHLVDTPIVSGPISDTVNDPQRDPS